MFLRFFFNRMSRQKQINLLKKKGILLGTRIKEGRRIHIYMLQEFFVEVLYKNDNIESEVEKLTMLKGLDNLNDYLENEFKTSFD